MRFLYFAIKFFPYWSIPLGLTFFEMGMIFRRRGNRPMMFRMAGVGSACMLVTVLYFVFRWDMTLYPWLRDHLMSE